MPVGHLSNVVSRTGSNCIIYGDTSDIWLASWPSKFGDQPAIVIKSLRGVSAVPQERESVRDKLLGLYDQWYEIDQLRHPNISRFFGIVDNCGPLPSIVLPFYDNGNALTYLKAHPEADRLAILSEVASALEFLHSLAPPVMHGNVRASNIMIKADGTACLTDIGLSAITATANFTTPNIGGSCRWIAPEVMNPPDSDDVDEEPGVQFTPQSDTYSWAMAGLEIYTGKPPFSQYKLDTVVIGKVVKGQQPQRPEIDVPEHVWKLWVRCWALDPSHRPSMTRAKRDLTRKGISTPTSLVGWLFGFFLAFRILVRRILSLGY
ncbi:hypothetical protein JAAARDRAFT_274932 [Jaapia argillacea MUCL 33604]|uniref:Protein kinase domain-containing protein n=1 Tax=Jaapia argillacea MUCL 33604 TaxID=933084 RepID=A0A067PSQ1_9AGAM|nr:hypothetical protein JAAARDRAFT_274932 [Jaapia argillacea MUCL 33604]